MAIYTRKSTKSELKRIVQQETEKIEMSQRRPVLSNTREKRQALIVLFIGILGLIGAPVARFTIWRRSYEPSISTRIQYTEHFAVPATLQQLSSN